MNKKVLICGDGGKNKEVARLIANNLRPNVICNSSVIIPIEKHDFDLLDKVAEKLKAKYPLYFNGLGMNATDILHKELHKDIDEVIAELKAEVQNEKS